MPLFKHHILNHRNLYLAGLAVILVSLPLSPFGVSFGTFFIAGNWILEGDFTGKMRMLRKQKGLLVFMSAYLLWVAGLWNTENFSYAFHDLKIKAPLLVIPLIMGSTAAIKEREFRFLSVLYLLALWAAVIAGFMKKAGIGFSPATDVREMGVFISHIRLALMIGVGILLAYELSQSSEHKGRYVFSLISILLFVVFLVVLQSMTGIFVLVTLFFTFFVYYIIRLQNNMLKYFLSVLLVMIVLLGIAWISNANRKFYTVEPLEQENVDSVTAGGNPYSHNFSTKEWENGHYTWICVCDKELRQEWNRVSNLDYDSLDRKGNKIKYTLIRYLTSKGLRKDSAAVNQLSPEDIQAIESGVANVIYTKTFSPYTYYYKWLWELNRYRETGDPSGHSMVQRLVYQKTGWEIARDHFFTGVGTGDVQDSFDRYYEKSDIPLAGAWRLRAHNQYLTCLITFGIFGLLWFLFSFYGPWLMSKRNNLAAVGFMLLAGFSMLWEDTLETQAGVYFMVFFYVFIIFAWKPENQESADHERNKGGQ
ncbi:MAG: O-antigen ligase family protein [Chlorobi bacterium]|nr:O-antigen ligase family protein [Chlorobiota bacterium]